MENKDWWLSRIGEATGDGREAVRGTGDTCCKIRKESWFHRSVNIVKSLNYILEKGEFYGM